MRGSDTARPTPGDHVTGALGVDTDSEVVLSVFVSILVEEGGECAPDLLAEAWANAGEDAASIVIRDIAAATGPASFGVLGVIVVIRVIIV